MPYAHIFMLWPWNSCCYLRLTWQWLKLVSEKVAGFAHGLWTGIPVGVITLEVNIPVPSRLEIRFVDPSPARSQLTEPILLESDETSPFGAILLNQIDLCSGNSWTECQKFWFPMVWPLFVGYCSNILNYSIVLHEKCKHWAQHVGLCLKWHV